MRASRPPGDEAEARHEETARNLAEAQRELAALREAAEQREQAARREAEAQREQITRLEAEVVREQAARREAEGQREEAARNVADAKRELAALRETLEQREQAARRDAEAHLDLAKRLEAEALRERLARREAETMREEAVRAAAEARRELAALRDGAERRQAAAHPEADTPREPALHPTAPIPVLPAEPIRLSTRVAPASPALRPQQAPTARELWLRGATDRSTPFVADAQTIVPRDVAAGGDARAESDNAGEKPDSADADGKRRDRIPGQFGQIKSPNKVCGRQAGAGQGPGGQAGKAFIFSRRLAPTVVASRPRADAMTKLPAHETRTTEMTPTDRLQDEGFRLPCRACGRRSAEAMEDSVHPVPKARLKAGALGSETIA